MEVDIQARTKKPSNGAQNTTSNFDSQKQVSGIPTQTLDQFA